ncbi:hypothetical protein TNIN_231121 [Trichonephila inaurata madagascariensis]|uniref:Uncharacterized protein n=1 Tax=Trichonephila inaurata madagascariensis TaxID=2747483 RepID=A0A8X6WYH8_9ARAC|nr:hypothetical protein TNIN_231121 [Trichonephila inaurata madagascariensis]
MRLSMRSSDSTGTYSSFNHLYLCIVRCMSVEAVPIPMLLLTSNVCWALLYYYKCSLSHTAISIANRMTSPFCIFSYLTHRLHFLLMCVDREDFSVKSYLVLDVVVFDERFKKGFF